MLRALSTGLFVAFAVFVVVMIGGSLRLPDATVFGLLCAPLAMLVGASLSGRSALGWFARVVNGAVGGTLAAAAAIAAVFVLREHTHWFDYHGDTGGELFMLMLGCVAGVPGGAAAAAARWEQGFGLALGLSLGVTLWMSWVRPINPGLVILLGIGVVVGTIVGAVRRSA